MLQLDNFSKVMSEVARIERLIHDSDKASGTLRPDGASIGRFYERLGMFVVAMCIARMRPQIALDLIEKVSQMPEQDMDYMTMIGALRQEGIPTNFGVPARALSMFFGKVKPDRKD